MKKIIGNVYRQIFIRTIAHQWRCLSMKTTKEFDCVEFQRNVRYQHYLEANGDVDLMIKNMKKRLVIDDDTYTKVKV